MPKVVFTSLSINNFSIINNIQVPLNNKGITIIDGPIGTGKSSILEAFYFCLTGEFFEKSNTFKSVINRFKNAPMVLELEGYTNTKFKIIRTMSFKSTKNSEVKHNIQFFIGDNAIHDTVNSTAQIQERILEYLDIDPLLLFNSKIFGQGDISSFTKVNDRKKKIILDKLVGVGICDKAHKITVTFLTEINNTLTTLNIEINNLEVRIKELTVELEELSIKQRNWNNNGTHIVSNQQQIESLSAEINTLNNEVRKLVDVQNELSPLVIDTSDLEDRIKKLKIHIPAVSKNIEEFNNLRIKIDRQKNYTTGQLSSINTDVKRLLDFYTREESTTCPTCYSEIDKNSIKAALTELSNKQKQIESVIEQQQKEIQEAEQKYMLWASKKQEIDNAVSKFSTKISSIDELKRKLDTISSKIMDIKSAIKVRSDTIEVLKHKDNTEIILCPYDELIESKTTELNNKKTIYNNKVTELQELESKRKYLVFLSKAFNNNGIPQLISNDALKVLNILMSNYKNKLLGNDFKLEFKTKQIRDNEEIYPDVLNPTGGDGYYRQSKGERRKIDLCQMFALSDFAKMQGKCDINVMFFDEVFSELNHSESEAVLEVIKDYPVTSKFIISHKDLFKEEFNNVIKMKKKGKQSVSDVNIIGWAGVNRETTDDN